MKIIKLIIIAAAAATVSTCSTAYATTNAQGCSDLAGIYRAAATDRDQGMRLEVEDASIQNINMPQEMREIFYSAARVVWQHREMTPQQLYYFAYGVCIKG